MRGSGLLCHGIREDAVFRAGGAKPCSPAGAPGLWSRGDNNLSTAGRFKNLSSHRFVGDCEDSSISSFAALLEAAADIRVEDVSDGQAKVTLTLPWSSAIEVLDLLQRHSVRLPQNA